MKMRTFYTVGLSLCLVLTLAAPACAMENTPASVPETTEGLQEILEGEPAQLPPVEIGLNENIGQEAVQNPGELQNQNAPQGVDAEEGPEGVMPPGLAAEADGAQSQDGAEDSEQAEPPEEMQEPGGLEDTNNSQNADGTQASGTDTGTEEAQSAEEIPNSGEAEGSEILSVPQDTLDDGQDMIDVLVPASGQIVVNLYRLEEASADGAAKAQMIHQPQALINYSAFPVTVDVTIVGTVPENSEAVLVSEPPTEDVQRKEVFLYAEFQSSPEQWNDTYIGAPNQLIATEDGSSGQGVLTLDASSEGYFRLSGTMAPGAVPAWMDTDTFGAILMFSFSAVSEGADTALETVPSEEMEWNELPTESVQEEYAAEPEDEMVVQPGEEQSAAEKPEMIKDANAEEFPSLTSLPDT